MVHFSSKVFTTLQHHAWMKADTSVWSQPKELEHLYLKLHRFMLWVSLSKPIFNFKKLMKVKRISGNTRWLYSPWVIYHVIFFTRNKNGLLVKIRWIMPSKPLKSQTRFASLTVMKLSYFVLRVFSKTVGRCVFHCIYFWQRILNRNQETKMWVT